MSIRRLGVMEKKVLGALIVLSDKDNMVTATLENVANIIGYKKAGGTLTYAMRSLEKDGIIVMVSPRTYELQI